MTVHTVSEGSGAGSLVARYQIDADADDISRVLAFGRVKVLLPRLVTQAPCLEPRELARVDPPRAARRASTRCKRAPSRGGLLLPAEEVCRPLRHLVAYGSRPAVGLPNRLFQLNGPSLSRLRRPGRDGAALCIYRGFHRSAFRVSVGDTIA